MDINYLKIEVAKMILDIEDPDVMKELVYYLISQRHSFPAHQIESLENAINNMEN